MQDDKSDFDIPNDVRAEAAIEEAKRILYTFGVLPDEYYNWYADRYAKDATQEGKERGGKVAQVE